MDKTTTEVYKYLNYLDKYLLGDLESFHKLCFDIEQKEQEDKSQGETIHSISGSMFDPNIHPSPSVTNETTKYPEVTASFGVPKYFRTTIPHALALFATIDIIGFLLGTENDPGSTTKNFEKFFTNLTVSVLQKKVLINVYRHGMAHAYFPKLSLGISYHSSNPMDKLFFKSGQEIVLNVNDLEKIVKQKFETIKVDDSLYNNMDSQFNKLTSIYEQKCRSDIEQLKASL